MEVQQMKAQAKEEKARKMVRGDKEGVGRKGERERGRISLPQVAVHLYM